MIPLFPKFKKMSVSDRSFVDDRTRLQPPYSTFNFTNLWSWDTREDRMLSILNDNLVVRFSDYSNAEPFFSFFGTNACENTAHQLLQHAEELKVSPKLRFVSEESTALLLDSKLCLAEDRDSFDYIFSTTELAEAQGAKFKARRNHARQFLREYPNAKFEIREFRDPSTQEQITSVIRLWETKKKKEGKIYDPCHEENAIRRLMHTAESHSLTFSCVTILNVMVGFSIDEILHDGYALAHFVKADVSFKGIYEFLNENVAKYLITNQIQLWNWQQDLNIPGLRKLKMSYKPVGFLKKFFVMRSDSLRR
ncbi:MAG: phosphatidylglycerol lysyltransferase domain-containing protein [Alphaproteobacteria bacterium]